MKNEKEQIVQKRTMDVVRKYGGYIYKNPQNMYTEVGRPDLCACVPVRVSNLVKEFGLDAEVGLFVGIEMKKAGHLSEVSDAQKIVGRQIQRASGIWFAIDNSEAAEDFMKKMRGDE